MTDFKGVWSELAKIWEEVDGLKEQSWLSINPRKLRGALDAIATNLKNLPARMKQYAAFDYVQKIVKSYLKVRNYVPSFLF